MRPAGSTFTNDSRPEKFSLAVVIGTSACGEGTLNRVAPTTYSEFAVTNGDAWLPAEFGLARISAVSMVVRSRRAMRGVLFALMNNHRPSGTPSVCDTFGWCASSHGTKP